MLTLDGKNEQNRVSRNLFESSPALEGMISRALSGYGIHDYTCDVQPGTKSVTTIKVTSGSEEYILKLHPYSPENRAEIETRLKWTLNMAETGLNVPRPIPDTSGRMTSSVASRALLPGLIRPFHGRVPGIVRASSMLYTERICELLSWVPGHTAKESGFGWRKARVAGCQLAMLHDHAERYSEAQDFSRPRVGLKETFGEGSSLWSRGPEFLDAAHMDILRRAAESVSVTTHSLGEDRDVFGPIHGDPTLGNVVFDGPMENPKASFIDFDDSVLGYYLMDLSIFLRSLKTFDKRHGRLASSFLKGYRCIREIPEDESRIRTDMEILNHASSMVWTLDSRSDILKGDPTLSKHARRISELLT